MIHSRITVNMHTIQCVKNHDSQYMLLDMPVEQRSRYAGARGKIIGHHTH
jgi:hypothetical protein